MPQVLFMLCRSSHRKGSRSSRGLELADPLNDILLSLDTIVLLQLALLAHPKCSRLAKLHRGVVPHIKAAA